MPPPTETFTLRLLYELAQRVRDRAPDNASAWIRQAIEEKLERDEPKKE